MALNDQPVDNLPEYEQAEHEAAHDLNTAMQVGSPQDESNAQSKCDAGLVVGEFAVLRRSFHAEGGEGFSMTGAQFVQALLHFGAQVVLNPCVGCFQALRFEDAADLSLYTGSIAGEA